MRSPLPSSMFEQKLLQLTIARVNEPVFAGSVRSVSVPGEDGAMELMADHTPLVSNLTSGEIRVHTEDGEVRTYPVSTGTLEVAHNQATILI